MQRISVRMKFGATLGFCLFLLLSTAQPAQAQNVQFTPQCPSPNPLCLDNNYFVTGDYVVGGVGLRGLGDSSGFATGMISIPDCVQAQAMTGAVVDCKSLPNPVPAGAFIVAAFLYWETVEKSASAFAGQNGFFNGYPITGDILGNPNAPTSWSSGGCSGSSSGTTTIRAYRADVRPLLPVDSDGNVLGNGAFQVRLADSGSNGGATPFTLGASLVVIYRVLNPAMPLNSIVIYDGAVAPNNQSAREMSQPMIGFYQPDGTHAAKVTHIVGDGQSNKSQQAFFQGNPLPFLYKNFPNVAFPGIYNQSWDNATWPVTNFVHGGAAGFDTSVTTSVSANGAGSGCVDWGAIIFSTTVQDTDGDGLLDTWEDNQGYTDAITAQNGLPNPFVALQGANKLVRDIFVEADYLSNLDGLAGAYKHSHLPKQQALDLVGDAFAKQNVHIHFDVGPNYAGNASTTTGANPDPYIIQKGAGGNSISESVTVCNDSPGSPCPFPGQAAIGWKGGFISVKDSVPLGNFQFGRKDSYHYMLFGHFLGSPVTYWTTFANTQDDFNAKLVSITNTGNTATVIIQTPQGLVKPGDCPNPAIPACSGGNSDRITVGGALTQLALNGTYAFTIVGSPVVDGNNASSTTLTIPTSGFPAGTQTFNFTNEPRLVVTYLGPTGNSGQSDFPGGADSTVTFGGWGADDPANCQADPSQALMAQKPTYCNDQLGTVLQQAGTIMHEMGHTLTLAHGGTYYDDANNPSVPSYGTNCKSNFQSIMSYLFQVRGFPEGGIDYSGQRLQPLQETSLSESVGIGTDLDINQPAAHLTGWYANPNALDAKVGRFATVHCDGTPITNGAQMVRVDGSAPPAPMIDWNNDLVVPDAVSSQDINFDGTVSALDSPFRGFNDWSNVDLLQISARENALGLSGSGIAPKQVGGGGGIAPRQVGGGGGIAPRQVGGGGGIAPKQVGGGGGDGNEQDNDTANSTADAPSGLNCTVSQGTVPACTGSSQPFQEKGKNVPLNWTAPGTGQTRKYFVWRANGNFPTLQSALSHSSQFTNLTPNGITNKNPNLPPTPTFTDSIVSNKVTYTYFVTDKNKQGATSGASTPLVVTVSF